MNRKKTLALLAFILVLLVPASAAVAAYSKTFTLTADVTRELPEATPEPTPTPTPEPTPTPDPSKQVKIVYHSGYDNDSITEYAPRRSTITLEGELFTRSWYKQIGWTTWPYSSFVEYEFGDSFRTGTNTEHFYAVWEYDWGWLDPWPWDWYGSSMSYDDGSSPDITEEETPTPEATAPTEDTPSPEDNTPSPVSDTPSPDGSIDTPVPDGSSNTPAPAGEDG